jgi:hypothetical protein
MKAKQERRDPREGALIVAIIIALVAATFLGTAIVSMATSARFQRLHAGMMNRALYLAESGVEYVLADLTRRLENEISPMPTQGVYELSNGDQFIVGVAFTNEQGIVVPITGVANPGSRFLQSRFRTIFELTRVEEAGGGRGTDLPPGGRMKTTGPSGRIPALNPQGYEVSLPYDWKSDPELDFVRDWQCTDELLAYDVQVKVNPYERGSGFSQHYLLGISFRHYSHNKTYGLSFFRSLTDTPPGQTPSWVGQLPASFQNLRGTNVYLVLWSRNGGIGTMDLINHRILTPDDGVVDFHNGYHQIRPYSTLLVDLTERSNATTGARENHIIAYIQSTNVYAAGVAPEDMTWPPDQVVFPNPVVWQNGATTVIDNRLTSQGFDDDEPPEIGIHSYYDQAGANKVFFVDFAFRMAGCDTIGFKRVRQY